MSTKLSYSGKGLIFRDLKYPEISIRKPIISHRTIRHVGLCPNAQTHTRMIIIYLSGQFQVPKLYLLHYRDCFAL